MKRYTTLFLALLACIATAKADTPQQKSAGNVDAMRQQFVTLQQPQPLAVYWYWIAGNISKEGVLKDLDAMHSVGINRVQIGFIGEDQGVPEGPVKMFSDEWWDILHAMFRRAGELDITVGLFNSPGWSQSGGPWVKAEQSMRYLACSFDTVQGGQPVTLQLPTLDPEAQRVHVVAFPLTESYEVRANIDAADSVIVLHNPKGLTMRSIVVTPLQHRFNTTATLYARNANGTLRQLSQFALCRYNRGLNVGFNPDAPIAVALPESNATTFELHVAQSGHLASATLSTNPIVDNYVDKTYQKMFQSPQPKWDTYMWRDANSYPAAKVVSSGEVMELTNIVDAEGTLSWVPSPGRWVVMQAAMVPTHVTNSPAPKEATGYETDKMSREHIRTHFDNFIGEILRRIPAEDRKSFKVVVADSYETGGQNWTDRMVEDFSRRYGYSPVPYLPVFQGVVVDSPEKSDRFLWDVRRLIADEIAYNYVGGLRDVSHEHGLTIWLENYGHWGFPGEFLQYGGQSDEISGEFWSFGTLGDIENRLAASCGHIYGKPRVWAESFTCGTPVFSQYPGQMKQRADRFFCEGINSTLYHLYIQQPDDQVPGINAWFGNEFNRNNTWFSQLDVFNNYIKRCNYMLQQGRYVADLAYYIGEDAPKMCGITKPEPPQGYSYDYVNAEVLLSATVQHGELCLASGMRYKVLVLPPQNSMRPEVAKKIASMSQQGLHIVGPLPTHSPSLQDYPECDTMVRHYANEINTSADIDYTLRRCQPSADLLATRQHPATTTGDTADGPALPIMFIHRATTDADIYFISNQSDQEQQFFATMRATAPHIEQWNPLTNETTTLAQPTANGEYNIAPQTTTTLPLTLQAYESTFIVFCHKAQATAADSAACRDEAAQTIDAPWKVEFEKGRGLDATTQIFSTLTDWSTHENPQIKYFSGNATYTTSFRLKHTPGDNVYIDLGKVGVMAKVYVNGQYMGGVWTTPYRLNITEAVRQGNNRLKIEVVNCWRNRLIGELQAIPEAERFSHYTFNSQKPESPLQPSGLMGPVQIITR